MTEYRDDRGCCYFHPREYVIGVCALCLNERLLVLASKQTHNNYSVIPNKVLPKIFALTNLLNRLEIKSQKPDDVYYSSSTSHEDSFISIKFEDNGIASWDKDKISKLPLDRQQSEMSMTESWDSAKKIKCVVEHAKPRVAMRWQSRIGHIVQFIRWKRFTKGNVSHVGKKIGAKVKYGWIRNLTKRKTPQYE